MRIKYDVRGVEGARKVLPGGVYNVKVAEATVAPAKSSGIDQLGVVLEVYGDKDHNGAKLFEYLPIDPDSAMKWKLREFLEAVGQVKDGKGEAGTLDTNKLIGKKFGVKTFVRPADDAKGFDEQARIRRMFPADAATSKGTDEDLLDDDDDEAEGDYDAMTPAELRAELRERGLSTKGKTPVLISRLMEDDEEQDDDDEDDGDDEGLTWEDLLELDRKGLRDLNKEEELGVKFTKGKDDDELRAEVAGALDIDIPEDEDEPEDDNDDEDEEDADDYDEWDDDDLKEELEQRSLSTKGSTKVLVRRLRADDAEEEKPF